MIKSKSQTKYLTSIQKDKHLIISDEPINLGGDNSGMTPHELLIGSLASCTSITLRMYAERKDWDLGEISITIQELETEVPTLQKGLSFSADLDDTQKNRLLTISKKCPVHKILEKHFTIQTEINK